MAKILIVDDEPVILSLTAQILSQKYDIVTATSGTDALKLYWREKPDLILADLLMPEMSGFELYEILKQNYSISIPVVFMTGKDGSEVEAEGFASGAADFIRKPFRPEVLLQRIENIINTVDKIKDLMEEACTDRLTGFLNKGAVTDKLTDLCKMNDGILMVIDLDSFKLVNDLYGHEAGDSILKAFADILRSTTRSSDVLGRIGGDEFVLFCVSTTEISIISSISKRLNTQISKRAKEILGDDMNIPLGASIGAVIVPNSGTDFQDLFNDADHALYTVKQNGKHGFAIHEKRDSYVRSEVSLADLHALNMIFEERNLGSGAYFIGQEAFTQVYRFLLRYIKTYKETAYMLLLTLSPTNNLNFFPMAADLFGDTLSQALRKSDIMVRIRQNQYLFLLPHVSPETFPGLVERMLSSWNKLKESNDVEISQESEFITHETEEEYSRRADD